MPSPVSKNLTKALLEVFIYLMFTMFKLIVLLLNLFPSNAYEAIPSDNNQFRRQLHSCLRGRRLNLGSLLIAYQRGSVKRRYGLHDKVGWLSVWPEDYSAIQEKWTF